MTKKLLFIATALVFLMGNSFSQNNTNSTALIKKLSGTQAPPQQWEEWFSAKVEEFKKNKTAGKAAFAPYNIPVIFLSLIHI